MPNDPEVQTESVLPADQSLPFFAYGVFKPKQLAYHRIKDFVQKESADEIRGVLKLRDGVPILVETERDSRAVQGRLICFRKEMVKKPYERISELEPWKLYRWEEKKTKDGIRVNVLYGRRPDRGWDGVEMTKWDGQGDPFFNEALSEVERIHRETCNPFQDGEHSCLPLIRLQMAYQLLWSSLERFASLRYHLGKDVMDKINKLGRDPCFAKHLKTHCDRIDRVHGTADLQRENLDPNEPEKSIKYYYQLRSNSVHRGKAAVQDFDRVRNSLKELLLITKAMLDEVFGESPRTRVTNPRPR